jgi:hypothetical protein
VRKVKSEEEEQRGGLFYPVLELAGERGGRFNRRNRVRVYFILFLDWLVREMGGVKWEVTGFTLSLVWTRGAERGFYPNSRSAGEKSGRVKKRDRDRISFILSIDWLVIEVEEWRGETKKGFTLYFPQFDRWEVED